MRRASLRPASRARRGSRPRRRRTGLLAVAAAVVLIGSGCGGSDPAPPGAADPGAGPAASSPAGAPEETAPPAGGADGDVPETLAFTGTTVAGDPFDAATLAGEPAVLWFWAPWCPICHNAAPDVLAAAEHVTVVGIGGLDQDSAMQGFVDRTDTGSLTHLSDPDGQVWQKFGVVTQDTYVVIDAGGQIVHNGSLSGSELRDRTAELAGA